MPTTKKTSSILDPFVMTLVAVVAIASIFPCYGRGAALFDLLASVGIVLLFFLHGAKLSRSAIVDGMLNWRLHIATLIVTFMVFPILGLLIVRMPWLDPSLLAGMLYLTLLPSTVQSSIAFTSMAKGNVPAAVCAATLSNLLGMFITPLLVAMLIQIPNVQSQVSMGSVQKIAMQLLLPFIVGHLMRPWIGSWVEQHKKMVGRLDRGSILLVVYTAFSAAVIGGLWSRVSVASLIALTGICLALLSVVFLVSWVLGRWLRLERRDAIVLFFCGSKKSLASGVPMAGTLFPESQVGIIILPVMIFHQLQLIACALIARRVAEEAVE
jgi:solute carrier family 10 (sodium/bile acid cotransporter), member 7